MDEQNTQRFEENLERFSFFSKEDANLLNSVDCKRISFCHNANGELNLQIKEEDHLDYLYSREDIQAEGHSWFLNLRVDNIKILYVFGVGLGNYYDACKEWLTHDATRFLIFLEDDLEILYHFLQTEKATEILHHKQVRVQYVDQHASSEGVGIDGMTTAFLFDPYRFSSLAYYQLKRA